MKHVLCSLLCLLAPLSAVQGRSVVFTLADGSQAWYQLGGERAPMLRFADGEAVVDADRYQFADILSFAVSEQDAPSGIAAATTASSVVMKGQELVVPAPDGVRPVIYHMAGRRMDVLVTTVSGSCVFRLQSLPVGGYVLKAGKMSFRFWKK